MKCSKVLQDGQAFLRDVVKHLAWLCCGLIVLLYSVQNVQHGLHHFVADSDHKACSALEESNPCHRRLVHHDAESGCSHESHVLSIEKHCTLCSILSIDTLKLSKLKITDLDPFSKLKEAFRIRDVNPIRLRLNLLNRGPPTFI